MNLNSLNSVSRLVLRIDDKNFPSLTTHCKKVYKEKSPYPETFLTFPKPVKESYEQPLQTKKNISPLNSATFPKIQASAERTKKISTFPIHSNLQLIFFNKEIRQASQTGNIEKAEGVLEKIKKLKIQPNLCTYSWLMQTFVKKNQLDKALEVFKKIQQAHLKLDHLTCNILLKIYVKKKNVKQASKVPYQMRQIGLIPNEVTYNTLLHLYVEKEDVKKAIKFFNQMRQAGLTPTEVTYNTLLHLYIKCFKKDIKQANKIIDQIQQANFKPNKVTINLMLDIYMMTKKLNELDQTFLLIANDYLPKKENFIDLLDCHHLSHGGACAMIRYYLKAKKLTSPFIVMTGVGHHSKQQKKFEMKKTVQKFLKTYYSTLDVQENSSNLGRLTCRFITQN